MTFQTVNENFDGTFIFLVQVIQIVKCSSADGLNISTLENHSANQTKKTKSKLTFSDTVLCNIELKAINL